MAERLSKQSARRSEPSLTALNPLFTCKTRAPVLPRPHLPRPRLLTAVRQGNRRRAMLVCAPAGAGKTTLLADFVRPANQTCAWYSVDDLDSNDISFLHGLSIAVGCTS